MWNITKNVISTLAQNNNNKLRKCLDLILISMVWNVKPSPTQSDKLNEHSLTGIARLKYLSLSLLSVGSLFHLQSKAYSIQREDLKQNLIWTLLTTLSTVNLPTQLSKLTPQLELQNYFLAI